MLALPSHLRIVECLDKALGFARVLDSKNKVRLIVLKLCDLPQLSDEITHACRDHLRSAIQIRSGILRPQKILTSKSAGVFIAFEDRFSVPYTTFLQQQVLPTTSAIVNALRDVSHAVDEFHSQGHFVGCIRPELILVDPQLNGVLVDFRVSQKLHRMEVGFNKSANSVEADRIAVASILRFGLNKVLNGAIESDPVSVMGAKRVYDKVVEYIDEPHSPCMALIDSIELELRGVSASVRKLRWSIVAQFPGTDQTLEEIAAQFRLELPLTKRELAEIAAQEELARREQEVSHGLSIQKPAVPGESDAKLGSSSGNPSQRKSRDTAIAFSTIGNVFLFSMVILALAVGYRLNPLGPSSVVRATSGNGSVQVTYVAADLKAKVVQLAEARRVAESLGMVDIAPVSWQRMESAYDESLKLNSPGSESNFMNAADKVLAEFRSCRELVDKSRRCQELIARVSSITVSGFAEHLRRLVPEEYSAVMKVADEGKKCFSREEFANALLALEDANSSLESLGRYRLKAAREERNPDRRLSILSPLLDSRDCPAEVFSLAAGAINSSSDTAIAEAERRLVKVSIPEKLVILSEATRLALQSQSAQKAADCFLAAVKLIGDLPEPQTDQQAITAAIELLITANGFEDMETRKQASETVTKWADAKLSDPFHAAMIAGMCMRLGDLESWKTMSQRSLADSNFAGFVDDIIGTNFVTAVDAEALKQGDIGNQLVNAPLASALRVLKLVESQSGDSGGFLESANQVIERISKKSINFALSEEILVAAGHYVRSENRKDPTTVSRLTGFAKAAICSRHANDGDLDAAQKAWRELPSSLLLKLGAAKAILKRGRAGKWTPEMEMRWAMEQRSEFDKAIAVIAMSKSTGEKEGNVREDLPKPVLKLASGTVLQWQGLSKSALGSQNTGSNGPGGIGIGRGPNKPSAQVPNESIQRLYIRNISENRLSGFVETVPANRLEYFEGTVENGFICGALTPLVPPSDGRTGKFFASLQGSHGIAYRTGLGTESQPSLSGIDLGLKPRAIDNDKTKAISELEARLLVCKLAHRVSQGGQELAVLAWDRDPIIYFHASNNAIQLAKSVWNNLTDNGIKNSHVKNHKVKVWHPQNEKSVSNLEFSKDMKNVNETLISVTFGRNSEGKSIPPVRYTQPELRSDGTLRNLNLYLELDWFYESGKLTKPKELEAAIQRLWVYSLGLGLGRDQPLHMMIESSFTDFGESGMSVPRQLTAIDRRAIEVFLEELRHGQKPEQVKRILFENKRIQWKFDL